MGVVVRNGNPRLRGRRGVMGEYRTRKLGGGGGGGGGGGANKGVKGGGKKRVEGGEEKGNRENLVGRYLKGGVTEYRRKVDRKKKKKKELGLMVRVVVRLYSYCWRPLKPTCSKKGRSAEKGVSSQNSSGEGCG